MTIGAGAELGYKGYVGIGEETTYGTKVTSSSFIEFNSEGFKRSIEEKVIDSINTTRNPMKRVQLGETIEGSIETYLDVASDGLMKIIKQAMGGTVASATVTSGCIGHTFNEGDMESNDSSVSAADVKSLTVQVRKGGSHQFSFVGNRVNSLSIKGEIGNPIVISANFVGKAASITSDTITPVFSTVLPLLFHGVTINYSGTAEEFQSFELTLNNNLVSDARALGSKFISVLPPAQRDIDLKLGQRFDTTTAWTRWTGGDANAVTILCDSGVTVSGSGSTTYSMLINLPKCYTNLETPAVGGKGIISQSISLKPIFDSTSAFAMQIKVNNATAGY